MKVFVTGATGVLGRASVAALVRDGHDVAGLVRGHDKATALEVLGAQPVRVQLFDEAALAGALAGFDAVCNLATHVPTGLAAVRPGAWKVNDRLRTEGSRRVAQAARHAGVGRLVQESVTFLYADAGNEWITESSPLAVTHAVEPAAIAETNAAQFGRDRRRPVILRFGNLVGDDPMTRWRLGQARAGRPVAAGDPWGLGPRRTSRRRRDCSGGSRHGPGRCLQRRCRTGHASRPDPSLRPCRGTTGLGFHVAVHGADGR